MVYKKRAVVAPEVRFMKKVCVAESGCWEWIGFCNNDGYAMFSKSKHEYVSAHRWAYQHFVGPIPAGLEIDHTCNVRNCVNPAHLEPITHQENVKRGVVRGSYKNHILIGQYNAAKTHCRNGHEYTPENTVLDAHNGARRCRICEKAKAARYYAKKRAVTT